MLEWLKRHAWKACNRPKRFRGSNPRLSAFFFGIRYILALFLLCIIAIPYMYYNIRVFLLAG